MKLHPDHSGFLHTRKPKVNKFNAPARTSKEITYFTDEELYAVKNGVMVFDLEIYANYFLAAFKCYTTSKVVTFELYEDDTFDKQKLLWVLHNFCLVGFNSLKFDLPIVWLAQTGASIETLNDAVRQIIKFDAMPSDIEAKYCFRMGKINHIDLIEVAPLQASLKAYGGRLHAPRLQDLPFEPSHPLTPEKKQLVREYCVNDLDLTATLLKTLEPQLELRAVLSKEYKQDLRSKSDAQIAEAVITKEVGELNGYHSKKPKILTGTAYKYNIPDYIQYKTPILQEMLELIRKTNFIVSENNSVTMPPELDGFSVKIGDSVYRMGIGGLHSSEECVSYQSSDDCFLIDRDVESYYPNIIINQELYPKHLGKAFLEVYSSIVKRRLAAKASGNKVVSDSLKIAINGSFGKLGSKYSNLYSPDLLIQVTISGQLSLLMLIEMIELEGIPVVSGNTDGIVIKCPQGRYSNLIWIIQQWEMITQFKTEETRYKALYSRDVNNYIAVKEDGKVKLKGAYAESGLSKNPTCQICIDAALALIVGNTPIEKTITECRDIRRFVCVRNVKGGGEQNGVYLGKVVRFIYSTESKSSINHVISGNKVPKSDNSRPLMDLPEEFPKDIDYERYVKETESILYEIGYLKKETQQRLF